MKSSRWGISGKQSTFLCIVLWQASMEHFLLHSSFCVVSCVIGIFLQPLFLLCFFWAISRENISSAFERSASQHSKKAADAYISGDHFSAQQFSAKAREEWTASERLNAIAAKEILSIRNNGKDPWKLDLHGLHALEAVQALQEHLQKLEHLVPSDRSLSPDRRNGNKLAGNGIGIGRSSSIESLTCTKTGGTVNSDSKYCASSSPQQLKQTSLHVITGVGNHSRGEAALPSAVKNFLDENGYRYDDARPGLITVKPKFRGRRALAKMAA